MVKDVFLEDLKTMLAGAIFRKDGKRMETIGQIGRTSFTVEFHLNISLNV